MLAPCGAPPFGTARMGVVDLQYRRHCAAFSGGAGRLFCSVGDCYPCLDAGKCLTVPGWATRILAACGDRGRFGTPPAVVSRGHAHHSPQGDGGRPARHKRVRAETDRDRLDVPATDRLPTNLSATGVCARCRARNCPTAHSAGGTDGYRQLQTITDNYGPVVPVARTDVCRGQGAFVRKSP